MSKSPSDDEIRQLAHRLWEEADRPDGKDEYFWHQAETKLRGEEHNKEQALDRGLESSSPASDPPSEIQRSEIE